MIIELFDVVKLLNAMMRETNVKRRERRKRNLQMRVLY